MKFRNILLSLFCVLAFSVIGLAQSPTQIKKKCPNTSIYSIVGITAIGDINVQPCVGRSTIFTQNVVLPSGGTITTDGLTGNPNLTFKGTVQTFTNLANNAEFKVSLLPASANGQVTIGDCITTPTICLSLAQSSNVATLSGTTVNLGDTNIMSNGTTAILADGTKTFAITATGSTAVFDTTGVVRHLYNRTITAAGTTGAQTINKPAGTVNVAAGQASIVITNNTVTTSSIPFVVLRTADGTCTFVKSAVPTTNTLTITLNANCTAETSVGFIITN